MRSADSESRGRSVVKSLSWHIIATATTILIVLHQIRHAINDFIEVYNPEAAPFEWTKDSVHQVHLKKRYADLCQ